MSTLFFQSFSHLEDFFFLSDKEGIVKTGSIPQKYLVANLDFRLKEMDPRVQRPCLLGFKSHLHTKTISEEIVILKTAMNIAI